MPIQLVVVRPFADYAKGDVVADEAKVAAILASEHVADVVRVHITSKEG